MFASMSRIMYIFPQYCYEWNNKLSTIITDENEEDLWGMEQDFNIESFEINELSEKEDKNDFITKTSPEKPKIEEKAIGKSDLDMLVTDSKQDSINYVNNKSEKVS